MDKSETWDGTKEKFLNITPEEFWRLRKILSNKKGGLTQTYKKNTEAKAKVYDHKQKTMQALESPAAVHAVFEKADEDLIVGNSECDIALAESLAAMKEFNAGPAGPRARAVNAAQLPRKPRHCHHAYAKVHVKS